MNDQIETIESLRAALAKARAETRAAFETRAYMYADIYRSLAEELGGQKAAELMKRGIYRRGLEVGKKYRAAAEDGNLDLVGEIFCEGSPSEGALFEPGVEARCPVQIVLRMEACPLVETWRRMGLAAEEVDTLCDIAAAVDEGTFAGAGLDLTFLDRLGKSGSRHCLLELSLPEG
ncbi:MAG: L-2-amino-thiazoline-4-carboxylic acid hydrolase [Coriobacteriia bacterium]|nr:L-2-amino-thiazoline-4-carboxylic acid hydrolase [Coriobacteriia bacterium]